MNNTVEVRSPGSYFSQLWIASFLLGVLSAPQSLAQHEMHDMPANGVHVTTMPANDEVLASSPESLMLHFESEVRLVKLVLRESRQGMIDIRFHYNPETGVHFMQSLPTLELADYYTVEWAVLDSDEKLVKGAFYFSFGDDARPPSFYLDQIDHPVHIMSPDYRLL